MLNVVMGSLISIQIGGMHVEGPVWKNTEHHLTQL